MNEKTMNGKKALKTALPVVIALVLIALITLTISLASRPGFNASIDEPNGAYLKLDGYVITNDKVYVNLRYNYGVSEMLAYVDEILLKDINVDRNSEEYIAVKDKLIYGENHEDLTATEKAEKLAEHENKLKVAGYRTEQDVQDYFDLEYRRTVYAKEAYKKYIADKGYSEKELEAGYLEMNASKYNDSVNAIVVTFDSEEEAKAVLELYGVDTNNLSTNNNWINAEKEAKRVEWVAEIEELEDELADAADSEKAAIQAKIDKLEKDILALGTTSINKSVYFSELEIQQIFVDMYNFMNAFYNGGDVSNYYDENGKLNPKYNILVDGVHYEVVEKEVEEVVGEEETKVTKKFIDIIGNIDEEKMNANCKLTFTEKDELDSTLSKYLFSSLDFGTDTYFKNTYTQKPVALANGGYFLTAILNKYEGAELEYDFYEEDTDKDDELVKPSEELIAEINAYLIEENFNDNIITQMLLELRAENNLVIYDNFLEAMYKAAYDYLYGTTLKIEDYPEYKVNKKNSKTLVFALNPENGEKVEVTAQKFFETLNASHGPQVVLGMMANYFVSSNPEFNKLYNPVTNEIYDEEAFEEAVKTSIKNLKYYFNAGYYASNGFTSEYGWNNFLHDYLRMDDEYELVLNTDGLEDAFKEYYKTTYTYEQILEEMKKIYDNDFYSLTVINVLVYTDYDQNGKPDEYELNEEKEQTAWTQLQEAKAQELLEAIYAAAPATGEDGLYKQLVAVVNEYSQATYNDPTWGTFKKFGLIAKAEAAADYTNTSSLVPEFLDKLSEVYKEIEQAGKAGTTFDTPFQVQGSFPTVYGYHKIAISGTKDRVYATKEPDKTLGYEELRDSQLALLTENVYKLYLEMQEDTFEDEKEEILKELGFDADYELSDELTAAIKAYYVPAVEALENENVIDLGFTFVRETAVNSGLYVFTNPADKEYYLEIEALDRADLEKAIADAEK